VILLDTNVLIYASDGRPPQRRWARRTIAEAVSGDGAAINAVTLAELCVGDAEPATVADRVRAWGIDVLDVPVAAAEISARAFLSYRQRHKRDSGKDSLTIPLPDLFIGAHAQMMGWTLATADTDRYKTYFPKVKLKTP
jgi:predicted nucleic acid-binding protein